MGQPGSVSGKEDRLGALELFRLAVEHHDVSVAQHRVPRRLAAQYPLTADAGEGYADTAAAHVTQRPPHCPGTGRDHHGLDLLAVLVTLVQRPRIASPDDVPQDGVAVAADVTHRPHHARHR